MNERHSRPAVSRHRAALSLRRRSLRFAASGTKNSRRVKRLSPGFRCRQVRRNPRRRSTPAPILPSAASQKYLASSDSFVTSRRTCAKRAMPQRAASTARISAGRSINARKSMVSTSTSNRNMAWSCRGVNRSRTTAASSPRRPRHAERSPRLLRNRIIDSARAQWSLSRTTSNTRYPSRRSRATPGASAASMYARLATSTRILPPASFSRRALRKSASER